MTFSRDGGLVLPSFLYRILKLKLPAVACTCADLNTPSASLLQPKGWTPMPKWGKLAWHKKQADIFLALSPQYENYSWNLA
jgi:hypothetical protein